MMEAQLQPPFAALVALKAGEFAKSRLSTLPDPLRRRLAWTMAVDTLTALDAVAAAVCVVSDQPGLPARLRRAGLPGVEVLPEQRRAGMNEALREGAEHLLRAGHPGVLACVGDLPALRAGSLRTVLAAATAHDRAFLPDATGVGTTMLCTTGSPLAPHFQGRSAAAHHSSGAVALTDAVLARPVPDARRDVDTEVDLADAIRLGLGPASAALVDPVTGRLGLLALPGPRVAHHPGRPVELLEDPEAGDRDLVAGRHLLGDRLHHRVQSAGRLGLAPFEVPCQLRDQLRLVHDVLPDRRPPQAASAGPPPRATRSCLRNPR